MVIAEALLRTGRQNALVERDHFPTGSAGEFACRTSRATITPEGDRPSHEVHEDPVKTVLKPPTKRLGELLRTCTTTP